MMYKGGFGMRRMGKWGKQFLSIAAGMILMLEVFGSGSIYGACPGAEVMTCDESLTGERITGLTEDLEEAHEVSIAVHSQWEGHYSATVTITNTGEVPIESWYLTFTTGDTIVDLWNGVLYEQDGERYMIKHMQYNQDIPPGESVTFGYTAVYKEEMHVPEDFQVLNSEPVAGMDGLEVLYLVTDVFEGGLNGEIRIENRSETVCEDWILEFDFENQVESFWTAELLSKENHHYIIKNAGYNSNIEPGQQVVLGFTCTSADAGLEPSGYQIRSLRSGASGSTEEPEEPDQPNQPEPPVREPEPLEDIGEAYFKQPCREDIVTNPDTGIIYVRNQILVSALPGADKGMFEELAADVEADIVGYIELTNDYQLEFRQEQTPEELEIMLAYWDSFSFVESTSLNTVTESGEDMVTTDDTLYQKEDWSEARPGGYNWGLEALRVPSAWDYREEFQPVRIGVIDDMFDEGHEDLFFDQVFHNSSEINGFHGTHVAGIMAAGHDNGIGISGVVTDSRLYAYAVDNDIDNMQTVMEYKYAFANLVGNHVKVINVSRYTGKIQSFAASRGNQNARNYVEANAKIMEGFLQKLILQGYDFVIVVAAGNQENEFYCVDDTSIYGYNEWEDEDLEENRIRGHVLAYYNNFLNAIEQPEVKARIITVGAVQLRAGGNTDADSLRYAYAAFSNVGTRVDVCAPGVEILSTIPAGLYSNISVAGYGRSFGTSMAAPYIAGIAGMLYQANPRISGKRVKQIICNYTYTTVLDAHGYSYGIPDAHACVREAFQTGGDNPDVILPSGILTGIVTDETGMPLENVKLTAYRTSTGESNLEDYYTFGSTDKNGNYEIILTQGTYSLNIYAEGYLPFVIRDIVILPDETTYMETTVVVPWKSEETTAQVEGIVRNALDGDAVANASVRVRPGWNNTGGSYVTDQKGQLLMETTDQSGAFTMNLPLGCYTIEIVRSGYITDHYNVVATAGRGSDTQFFVLVPVLANYEYRIVLTWGDTPQDLDAHLTYNKNGVQQFHVYYHKRTGKEGSLVIARLDRDDRSGYGPETITFKVNETRLQNGVFQYTVEDYTNRGNPLSSELAASGAVVRVYQGNHLAAVYPVPHQTGTSWYVFELTEEGIVPYNKVGF